MFVPLHVITCLKSLVSSSILISTHPQLKVVSSGSDTSTTNTTTSNSNTALLEELLNTTRDNDQDIKAINQKIDGLMSTTTTKAGAINDILIRSSGTT